MQNSTASSRIADALRKAREEKSRASAVALASTSIQQIRQASTSRKPKSDDEGSETSLKGKGKRASVKKEEETSDIDLDGVLKLHRAKRASGQTSVKKEGNDNAVMLLSSSPSSDEIPLKQTKSKHAETAATAPSPKRKKTASSADEADTAAKVSGTKLKGKTPALEVGILAANGSTSTSAIQPTLALKKVKKAASKVASPKKTKSGTSPRRTISPHKVTSPKSPRRGKGRTKGRPKAKGPAQTASAVMPDYESWEKETLQAETARYGYKAAGSRKVLVGQLVRVWRALHPAEAAAMDAAQVTAAEGSEGNESDDASCGSSSAQSTPQKKQRTRKEPALAPWKRKGKGKAGTIADAEQEEAAPRRRRRSSSASSRSSRSDDLAIPEESINDIESESEMKTAGDRLRERVLANQTLYMRLLRYEVRFSVVRSSDGRYLTLCYHAAHLLHGL